MIGAQDSTDRAVSALAQQPAVKAALAAAKGSEPQTIETQIRLAEIPAPPFKEAARGEEMKRLFQQAGLQNVRVDKAGNVLGDRPGRALHPHVVVAAHLDTVFPEGTNVKVRREGAVLYAPGIGDDSRGLAVLVAIARALNQANVQTPGSITFVADVGEEGLGDLRGMRAIFDDTLKGTVDRFVTIDGTGMGVAHTFVGSRRYRVTVKGPGGHSFADFGMPNPIGATRPRDREDRGFSGAARFADHLQCRTDWRRHVGQLDPGRGLDGGGPAISRSCRRWPGSMRSSRKRSTAALAAEHARWRQARCPDDDEGTGGGPSGRARRRPTLGVVQAALAATRAVGRRPVRRRSARATRNYPTSLRIPSVQIGGGGRGRRTLTRRPSRSTRPIRGAGPSARCS